MSTKIVPEYIGWSIWRSIADVCMQRSNTLYTHTQKATKSAHRQVCSDNSKRRIDKSIILRWFLLPRSLCKLQYARDFHDTTWFNYLRLQSNGQRCREKKRIKHTEKWIKINRKIKEIGTRFAWLAMSTSASNKEMDNIHTHTHKHTTGCV